MESIIVRLKSKIITKMSNAKMWIKSALIEVARLSGLPQLFASSCGGVGAIMALHRVRAPSDESFQPNRTLEVTPAFLDWTLTYLREQKFEIVSLDEMQQRLEVSDFKGRFVCFTLDDGYADNFQEAFPIFKAHEAPFSIYLTTGFVDRTAFFWWMLLEEVIRENDVVKLRIGGREERLATGTLREKMVAFKNLHGQFRALSADVVEATARDFCADYGVDPRAHCAAHAMTWDMAREITEAGLGTIEAHTERHVALSLQHPEDILAEMARSSTRIAEKTGRAPHHFAFPFGDAAAVSRRAIDLVASLPLATATTTRPGLLRPEHAHDLSALPRVTLNGYYQSKGYVDLVLSGLPHMFSRF